MHSQISPGAQKSQTGSNSPPAMHAAIQLGPMPSQILQASRDWSKLLTERASSVGAAETRARAARAKVVKKVAFIVREWLEKI